MKRAQFQLNQSHLAMTLETIYGQLKSIGTNLERISKEEPPYVESRKKIEDMKTQVDILHESVKHFNLSEQNIHDHLLKFQEAIIEESFGRLIPDINDRSKVVAAFATFETLITANINSIVGREEFRKARDWYYDALKARRSTNIS